MTNNEAQRLFDITFEFAKTNLKEAVKQIARVIYQIEKMESSPLFDVSFIIMEKYAKDYIKNLARIIWSNMSDLPKAKPLIDTFLLSPVLKLPVEQLSEFQEWKNSRVKSINPKKVEVVEASAAPKKQIDDVKASAAPNKQIDDVEASAAPKVEKPPDTTLLEREARRAPPPFLCPITKFVFNNAVLGPDGWSYEKDAYIKYLETHQPGPDGLVIMPNNSKVDPKRTTWTTTTIQKLVNSWRSGDFDINLLKVDGQWAPQQNGYIGNDKRQYLIIPLLYDYFAQEISELQKVEQQAIADAQMAKIREEASRAPKAFICPFTNSVMNEPILASDGFSYEKQALENWLTRTAPNDHGLITLPNNSQINPNEPMTVNIKLAKLIATWRKTGDIPDEDLKFQRNNEWNGKWMVDVFLSWNVSPANRRSKENQT
jgi:hypothetical protein